MVDKTDQGTEDPDLQPLRSASTPNRTRDMSQMAAMSRRRFVCFQFVSLLTALITCFTLLGVTLLKNEELQNRLLRLGQTATCLLNTSTTDPQLLPENPEPANWNNFFAFLLRLSQSCAASNHSN